MAFSAPEHLRLPDRLVRSVLRPLWLLLMIVAIAAQLTGTWRAYERYYTVDAAFGDLGLRPTYGTDGALEIERAPGVSQVESIPDGWLIYSVNGINLGDAPIERYAELLAGAEGSYVAITVGNHEDTQASNHYLVRSSAHRAKAQPFSYWLIDVVLSPLLGLVAAGIGLYASALLMRRREDDPVAIILAIGLVGLVLTGDQPLLFLDWIVSDPVLAGEIYVIGYLLAFVPLAVALPAFPDNVYRPPWSGWLAVAAPLLAFVIYAGGFIPSLHPTVRALFTQNLLIPLVIIALVASFLRFRRTPVGRERQQLKWAALGFVLGLATIVIAEVLLASSLVREGPAQFAFWSAAVLLRALGAIVIPLGVVMSVLGLRLNDADSAIGRSAGYALITLLIGAVWAGSTTWINRIVGDAVAPAVATGISTMLAAAIFVPTRERIMKWMEARFQPALVKMRGLPAKLGPWRHDHDPTELAKGTLLAIVNGVQASSAALVLNVGGTVRVLATYDATEEEILSELERDPSPEERAFPLRYELEDLLGPVGVLLLGPRTDGASYSSDERSAVALVKGPLAEALRATSRRAGRNLVLAEMLTAVDARVARLEALRGVG